MRALCCISRIYFEIPNYEFLTMRKISLHRVLGRGLKSKWIFVDGQKSNIK